jgi:hypothetical protein
MLLFIQQKWHKKNGSLDASKVVEYVCIQSPDNANGIKHFCDNPVELCTKEIALAMVVAGQIYWYLSANGDAMNIWTSGFQHCMPAFVAWNFF